MAGDWIKIETTLPDKPEVSELAELLRIDPDAVVGKLVRFWIWANQQTVDGDVQRVTDSFIDRLANCPGFCGALREVGWLSRHARTGRVIIPSFDKHNGQSAKARALTADRVRRSRNSRTDKGIVHSRDGPKEDCNGTTVTEALRRPSLSVTLLSYLERFEPEKRQEFMRWAAHFENRVPEQRFTEIQLEAALMDAKRKGWSDEKISASINFSISVNAKAWKDPDNDFDQQKNGDEEGGSFSQQIEKLAKRNK